MILPSSARQRPQLREGSAVQSVPTFITPFLRSIASSALNRLIFCWLAISISSSLHITSTIWFLSDSG